MKELRTRFRCGKLSLEGVLGLTEVRRPSPAIIICHPHPLYGGSMDNNVVNSLFEAFGSASIIPFKFNFRGVGNSEGEYSNGTGEQEDIEAAISFITTVKDVDLNRIGIAGYSAGASFGLPAGSRDSRIKVLAAISPPLSMSDFDFLKDCFKPKLLISGDKDGFTPAKKLFAFCQSLPDPKECDVLNGADHFWRGYESTLAAKVTAFFTKSFQY